MELYAASRIQFWKFIVRHFQIEEYKKQMLQHHKQYLWQCDRLLDNSADVFAYCKC